MAFIGQVGKKYGLILKSSKSNEKPKEPLPKESTVFGEESSDEEDKNFKVMKFDMKKEAWKAKMKKQTQLDIEKALQEDASVFQYDEVYDEISNKKQQATEEKKKAVDRTPKYMDKLLKTAASRKLDMELLEERKVQKEREAEKDQFADKEAYVTSSYKAKMAELKALQEKQRQEEMEEQRLDVTKMGNMNGFYRYVLNTQTRDTQPSSSKDHPDVKQIIKEEPTEDKSSEANSSTIQSKSNPTTSKRQYRRRQSSASGESATSDTEMETKESETDVLSKQESAPVIKTEIKDDKENHHDSQEEKKEEPDSSKPLESPSEGNLDQTKEECEKEKPVRRKLTEEEIHEGVMAKISRKTTSSDIEAARNRYFLRQRSHRGPLIEVDSD